MVTILAANRGNSLIEAEARFLYYNYNLKAKESREGANAWFEKALRQSARYYSTDRIKAHMRELREQDKAMSEAHDALLSSHAVDLLECPQATHAQQAK